MQVSEHTLSQLIQQLSSINEEVGEQKGMANENRGQSTEQDLKGKEGDIALRGGEEEPKESEGRSFDVSESLTEKTKVTKPAPLNGIYHPLVCTSRAAGQYTTPEIIASEQASLV